MKVNQLITIAISCLLLGACGGDGGGSSIAPAPVKTAVAPLTISNPGIIPLFVDSRTRSGIFIHNHTDKDINGISYKVSLNAIKLHDGKYLNSCKIVPANSSCFIGFEVPEFDGKIGKLAADVQVSYKDAQGNWRSFGQVLNFAYMDSGNPGIHIASGGLISGYGNGDGYATMYLYAAGPNPSQKYVIDKLSVGKGLELTNSTDLSGTEMSRGLVNVVEVKSEVPSASYRTSIDLALKDGSKSQQNVFVLGAVESSFLASSFVPLLIATTEATSSSTVYLANVGSQPITIDNTTVSGKITLTAGSTCTGVLAAGSSCEIPFSVDHEPNSSVQTGTVKVAYGGTTLAIPVNWVTIETPYAWAQIKVTDPINLIATQSQSEVVTVTNTGAYSLTMLEPRAQINTGSGIVTVTDGENGQYTCKNAKLEPKQSCKYTITVSDSKEELNQQLLVYAEGTYVQDGTGKTLSIPQPVTYHSRENRIVLKLTPSVVKQEAQQGESDVRQVEVTNLGYKEAPDLQKSITEGVAPSYWHDTTDQCIGTTLVRGQSCNLTFTLSPQVTTPEESSQFRYNVLSGTESGAATVRTSVLNPNGKLELSVSAAGADTSGTGESQAPYIFQGYNTAAKSITLTYTNKSLFELLIKGFDFTGLTSSDYDLDEGSTCLIGMSQGLVNKGLASGDSCTVVFKYRPEGSRLGQTTDHAMNITLPTLYTQILQGPAKAMTQTPRLGSSDTLYATAKQAQLVTNFEIESNGTSDARFKITNTLNNATGYGTLGVNNALSNYVLKDSQQIIGGSCTNFKAESGMVSYDCTLSSTAPSGEVIYTVAPVYLSESATVFSKTSVTSGLQPEQVLAGASSAKNDILNPMTAYMFYMKWNDSNNIYACKIGKGGNPGNCIQQSASSTTAQHANWAAGMAFYSDGSGKYKYAYLASGIESGADSTSIYQCDVNMNNAVNNIVSNCNLIHPAGISAVVTGASGIDINGDNIYINYSSSDGDVYTEACKINANNGSIVNCHDIKLPTTSRAFGITHYQNYVYILRYDLVTICKMDNNGVIISNSCSNRSRTNMVSDKFLSLAVANNGYLYATNYGRWGTPNDNDLVYKIFGDTVNSIPFSYTCFVPEIKPSTSAGVGIFGDYVYVGSYGNPGTLVVYKANEDGSLEYMNSKSGIQEMFGDIRILERK